MNLKLKLMNEEKTSANLETLARKLAREFDIMLDPTQYSGNCHPFNLSGTNKGYCLEYYVDEDDDGRRYECLTAAKIDRPDIKLSISYLLNYILNICVPQSKATQYKCEVDKRKDNPFNKLDCEFMQIITMQLSHHLNDDKSKLGKSKDGCTKFVSCGLKVEEDELSLITANIIKKYLNI